MRLRYMRLGYMHLRNYYIQTHLGYMHLRNYYIQTHLGYMHLRYTLLGYMHLSKLLYMDAPEVHAPEVHVPGAQDHYSELVAISIVAVEEQK